MTKTHRKTRKIKIFKSAKKAIRQLKRYKYPVRKKRKPVKQNGVMAVIPYSEIAKVQTYKGKFSMVPTTFTERQVMAIIAPTPKNVIKSRPGKGGGNWDYIPGWWFKKKLNFVFGFDGWDTVIDGERVDGDYITVKGKLIIKGTKTRKELVSKADYGGAEIKYHKEKPHKPEHYLDISNDFKAAQTDLVKRCCVQLGFAMDVYGKNESVGAGYDVTNGNEKPSYLKREAMELERKVTGTPASMLLKRTGQTTTGKVDYRAKLDAWLTESGLKTLKDKMVFLKSNLPTVKPYNQITQSEAQAILATLMKNDLK